MAGFVCGSEAPCASVWGSRVVCHHVRTHAHAGTSVRAENVAVCEPLHTWPWWPAGPGAGAGLGPRAAPICGPPGRALWVGRHAEPRSVNGKRTCLVPLLSWPHSDKSCLLPPSQEPPGGPAAGLAVSFIRPQAHRPDSHDPGVVLDEEVPSPSAPTAASPSRALAPGPSVSAAHGGGGVHEGPRGYRGFPRGTPPRGAPQTWDIGPRTCRSSQRP